MRYLITLTIAILFPLFAYAGLIIDAGGGGGGSLTCTDANAVKPLIVFQAAASRNNNWTLDSTHWTAKKVVFTQTTRITSYSISTYGNGVGDVHVSFYTDNAGVPGTEVAGTATTGTPLNGIWSNVQYVLATPINMSAGTYYIVSYGELGFSGYTGSLTPVTGANSLFTSANSGGTWTNIGTINGDDIVGGLNGCY